MKNLIFIIAVLNFTVVFGQKKKSYKTLSPPQVRVLEIKELPIPEKKCFTYKYEAPKDSLIFESTTLLEFGWNYGENARIIIENKEYDPIREKEAKQKGYDIVWKKTIQYINGTYKIKKDILTFTPEKLDKYETQTFKLIYKPKSKVLDCLIEENEKKYIKGNCSEPIISVGM